MVFMLMIAVSVSGLIYLWNIFLSDLVERTFFSREIFTQKNLPIIFSCCDYYLFLSLHTQLHSFTTTMMPSIKKEKKEPRVVELDLDTDDKKPMTTSLAEPIAAAPAPAAAEEAPAAPENDPMEMAREEMNMFMKGELVSLATSVTRMNQQMQAILNEIRQHQDEVARKQEDVSRLKMNITHVQGLIAGVKKVQLKLIDTIGIEEG
jgi:hypothetical protein